MALYLSAFDTIDHDILLNILEQHLGIKEKALKLLKSYFSSRFQAVKVDNVLSELVELVCGVPQGSVLGPLKFCLYMLPLGAILRHHCVDYHIYADDTQIYLPVKLVNPIEAISKIDACIADLRTWMIENKLKINDSKTEFLVISSTRSKYKPDNLFVTVGTSKIYPSQKCKSLGAIFDKHLNFHSQVSQVCKSTYFALKKLAAFATRSLMSP